MNFLIKFHKKEGWGDFYRRSVLAILNSLYCIELQETTIQNLRYMVKDNVYW